MQANGRRLEEALQQKQIVQLQQTQQRLQAQAQNQHQADRQADAIALQPSQRETQLIEALRLKARVL